MKKKYTIIVVFLLFSCHQYSSKVREALDMAGDNKNELIKVLDHYKEEGKEEKLKAAEFLIENLPYNYAYDTTNLYKYRIVGNTADLLIKKNLKDSVEPVINRLWGDLKIKEDPYNNIYSKPIQQDIEVITSKYLIDNIDNAYDQWKKNPYTKDSVSFNDFCEYVLPYRLIQGKAIENWRSYFLTQNKRNFFEFYPMSFIKASDSICEKYENNYFHYSSDQGIPLLKFADYLKIREGDCMARSWINTYIFNAKGVPMVTDFVPAWGHKMNAHQWNAIIYGGRTIYFDPFSSPNNTTCFNNLYKDTYDGNVRLPKVYRNTYSTHIEGPISDKRINIENIPPLFINIKKMDVSEQYFKAIDVFVQLTKKTPENTYYAYLCVLGANMQWIPVQWGEVNGNTVKFKKMGTDIVYQMGFYENGNINPCGVPFHLDRNGKLRIFKTNHGVHDIVVKRRYPLKELALRYTALLKGSLIQASNNDNFSNSDILDKIDFDPEPKPYDFFVKRNKKYRYFRIISKNEIKIRQMDLFYLNHENKETIFKGKLIENIPLDNNSITWKGIDLGVPKQVTGVRITPPNNGNHIVKNFFYELFYVDQGRFISLGIQKATSYELKFSKVPKNALLYLKCLNEGKQSRIFECLNGEQIWH